MSGRNKGGEPSHNDRVKHSIKLLQEALKNLDSVGLYPEIGARIVEIIESLKEELGD